MLSLFNVTQHIYDNDSKRLYNYSIKFSLKNSKKMILTPPETYRGGNIDSPGTPHAYR